MMAGNTHYGTAKLALQRVETEDCWYKHVGVGPGDEAATARAQVQATLALAYEQRTANLIAFERDQWEAWRRNELNEEGMTLYKQVAEQIPGRLGLK